MKNLSKSGFSLIEFLLILVIVGVLVFVIESGSGVIQEAKFRTSKLKNARSLNNNSPVLSIPDLALWLDATNLQYLKTSNVANIDTTEFNKVKHANHISAWQDQNPHAVEKITLVAPTDINRPSYITYGVNNLPALNFIAANSNYLIANRTPISSGNDSYTIFAVFKATSLPTQAMIVSQSNVTPVANKVGSLTISPLSKLGFEGHSNSYTPQLISLDNNYIGAVRVDNSHTNNITVYTNGISSSGTSSKGAKSLNIGGEVIKIGEGFDGFIAEVIIFNRALNDKEIESINSYLSAKYDITLN